MGTKVLVVGAGIAGPTTAFWLARYGFEPTLVERAPALREGGYVIDFWGAAFDLAERMDVLSELQQHGYRVQELRIVGDDGQTVGGFDAGVFQRLTGGRYLTVARSTLARALYERLDDRIERRFGTTIRSLEQHADAVNVQFEDGSEQRFDLVIGADGQHSRVRELAFGPESQFEKYLGYNVAVFEVAGYRPRAEDVYVLHTQRGRQIGRFSLRDDRTMFLFVWVAPDVTLPRTLSEQRELLRQRFADSTWESDTIVERMQEADEIYIDRVSQIRMPGWSRGRVALVGDAAHCVSLLAGQGSALAMIGANVLAGELLLAHGNHSVAFERYQSRLNEFMQVKQHAGAAFGGAFAPKTSLGLFARNQLSKLLRFPLVAELAMARGLRDAIELPHYAEHLGRGQLRS